MTVTLDGKGMKLDLPGGHLEGHPVSMTIALADFAHPVVQLNATNSFLDFEVMKFIRIRRYCRRRLWSARACGR